MNGTTSWRTTDLCLFSTRDLTLLADALEARGLDVRHRALRVDEAECFPIVEPQWLWRIQSGGEEEYRDPEPQICRMLAAVETLDAFTRTAWTDCTHRVFDVAYDCGTHPFQVRNGLSAELLKRLADVGASLRITLYAYEPNET